MRVLVVDDDAATAATIARQLEEEGYTADTAVDGGEAYRKATANCYELIVLDVILPTLDGLSLCRHLRQNGDGVGILMLSRADSVDDRVAGLEAGADDYLVKPFAFRELLARLQALARVRRGREQTRLEAGGLVLDLVAHTAERDGLRIDLTEREFALLELLLRHASRPVSRTVIADRVWHDDFSRQSNVVDVYISHLRRKIDDPFPDKLIETVRGIGYRITRPEAGTNKTVH